MLHGKRNGKGLGGLPLSDNNAGLPEFWGQEVLVYMHGVVNMTGVDFVTETKAVVLPPRF